MKKVVIYARVSTKDQTCERQISELREIAKNHDYQIVDEYMDDFPEKFILPMSSSKQTLTMGELIKIIDETDDLGAEYPGLVKSNIEYMCEEYDDPEEISGFVTVTSVFYPDLHSYYEEQKLKWIKRIQQN